MPYNSTKKTYQSNLKKAAKIAAFNELTRVEGTCSQRAAAKLLSTPRSTIQKWQMTSCEKEQLDLFFASPVGAKLLQRIIVSAEFVIQFRNKGVRSAGEFISLSGLGRWVAHSHGAMHSFSKRCEEAIIAVGKTRKARLSQEMSRRRITLCEDETFHQGCPCLVAIDSLSNFIFLEEYAEQRKAENWNDAIDKALNGLDVEIVSVTSDQGAAILSHVKKNLGTEHSPDLFHVQQEVSKALSAPLRSQENQLEKELISSREKVEKMKIEYKSSLAEVDAAQVETQLKEYGCIIRSKRRELARETNRGIGQDYHPIDLQSGAIQPPEKVKASLEKRFDTLLEIAREACLSGNCTKRIRKAQKMIGNLVKYLTFYFLLFEGFLQDLNLESTEEEFFKEVLFPLAYLIRVEQRANKEAKAALLPLKSKLEVRIREGPVQGEALELLKNRADEIAHLFQRSSSCVEGRNGVLSMMHGGFHGLSEKRLEALTVIHNYYIRRWDGSTAAERFFGKKHGDLFEDLLTQVRIPGSPRAKWRADRKGAKPRQLAA